MARGRIINSKISMDKAVHNLNSDTCKLAYTWAIPHLDREGRMYGDPALVKSIIFPRRIDITVEDIEGFIKDWVVQGLVILYEVNEERYLFFPGFSKNQPGLRKDKEPDSVLPAPEEGKVIDVTTGSRKDSEPEKSHGLSPDGNLTEKGRKEDGSLTEDCRKDDGKVTEPCRNDVAIFTENVRKASVNKTEKCRHKRREEKLREENTIGESADPPAEGENNLMQKEETSLYQKINQSFLSQNGNKFTNYGKEGKAIQQLIKKAQARSPDDPEGMIKSMITKFWDLKNSRDKFWSKQPFLPSALNASGIWDRVLEEFRENSHEMTDEEFQKLVKEAAF